MFGSNEVALKIFGGTDYSKRYADNFEELNSIDLTGRKIPITIAGYKTKGKMLQGVAKKRLNLYKCEMAEAVRPFMSMSRWIRFVENLNIDW